MDGLVGSPRVVDRSVVPANAPLMTLVDLSRLEVEIEIPETYMSDLGVGMKSEIVAGDVKATGKLVAISPEVIRNQVLARVPLRGRAARGPAAEPARGRAAPHRRAQERAHRAARPFRGSARRQATRT
jgi:HlyD family secretion protein